MKDLCECGSPKDRRAKACKPCSRRAAALRQWANPETKTRISDGLKAGGLSRRRRFSDLSYEQFTMAKKDGRKFTYYWGEDEKMHYIYRYQWVWIQANGQIARRLEIHHKDKDCTNDDLSNLEALTKKEHNDKHPERSSQGVMAHYGHGVEGVPEWICFACGSRFKAYSRKAGVPRKFCSLSCRNQAYRNPV